MQASDSSTRCGRSTHPWPLNRAYNGFVATVVVDGEITYQIGRQRKAYKAGGTWASACTTRAKLLAVARCKWPARSPAWPLAARAQQSERMRRIGLLVGPADDWEGQARVTAFKQGLQELLG